MDLLAPVGDFECLKAAVQNGADSVYFGASSFNARASAANFDFEALKNCIEYAKLRGVKTNLTLNIVLKDSELKEAISLAKKAYEYGIDAIIVQDLGIGSYLIKHFPDLAVHASTQMTTHNLEGVLQLEEMGFKRVVLARELPIEEIEFICQNCSVEIEVFVHGALCISYSGQCLFSSMIGGRSGNRGKCAQPCRLPYQLLENDSCVDSGYLLSPRCLYSLDFLPSLQKAGVSCLKIEGRMKPPQYVAAVTRIYRKYLNLAQKDTSYQVDKEDKKILKQVFNRGGFSHGHLETAPNENLIFPKKPSNMGLPLGKILHYSEKKGLITIQLEEKIAIGDQISFEKEEHRYTISELMKKNNNIKEANIGETITLGRMKGNLSIGDPVYKMKDKKLDTFLQSTYEKEEKKVNLDCHIKIQKDTPIQVEVLVPSFSLEETFSFDFIPLPAENKPIEEEKIRIQFSKTKDTPFTFSALKITLDNELFLPVSTLNEVRRVILEKIQKKILTSFSRPSIQLPLFSSTPKKETENSSQKVSVYFSCLDPEKDYTKLLKTERVYLTLETFLCKSNHNIIKYFEKNSDLYFMFPTILQKKEMNIMKEILPNLVNTYSIKGFVLSNISQLSLLCNLEKKDSYNLIANYTLNTFNQLSIQKLKEFGFSSFTISPESEKESITELTHFDLLDSELIVYGRTPLMTCNYCFLGKSNRCHSNCKKHCNTTQKRFYLKDRLGFQFPITLNNRQTISTIYNAKTTSISSNGFCASSVRIDLLDESIDEINTIIQKTYEGNRLEGKDYTNGNLNRPI